MTCTVVTKVDADAGVGEELLKLVPELWAFQSMLGPLQVDNLDPDILCFSRNFHKKVWGKFW